MLTLIWLWFTSEIIHTVLAINLLEYSCLGSTVIGESKIFERMLTHVSNCIIFSLNQPRIPPVFCILRAKNGKAERRYTSEKAATVKNRGASR